MRRRFSADTFAAISYSGIDRTPSAEYNKEVIIGEGAEKYHDGEKAAFPVLHVHFERQEHQREIDDGLVKMVEKDIVDRKAGKGVQQPAHDGKIGLREAAQEEIGRQGGAGKFEHQQGRHQIGHRRAGE